jgi:hypothetical protein
LAGKLHRILGQNSRRKNEIIADLNKIVQMEQLFFVTSEAWNNGEITSAIVPVWNHDGW